MRREEPLPPEFGELAGKVNYIVKVGINEYAGSCPFCGGSPHPDGSFPDRFRMFIKSRATGKPLGWCRNCGKHWLPGKPARLTPEQMEAWKAERLQAEERRLEDTRNAIQLLQDEKPWIRYHRQLTPEAVGMYEARGLGEFWQEFWQLGLCENRIIFDKDGQYFSNTLTIPVFAGKDNAVNLRHRILSPRQPSDKYRPEHKGLPASLFIADYERKLSGRVLLVEGEFKAMTTFICADDPKLHVVGIPGKSPDLALLEQLKDCEPVYVCLDPDAYDRDPKQPNAPSAVERVVKVFQKRCRLLKLPEKIDDMINIGIIGKSTIKALLSGAKIAM